MPDLELLGRAVKQLQHRHHRALEHALADLGVSLVQWDALRAIDHSPGSSAHALAVATFQTDQSFGTLAVRLETKALITRASGRGRAIEHRLTPEGQRVLEAGRPLVRAVFAESFANLTDQEGDQLLALLQAALGED